MRPVFGVHIKLGTPLFNRHRGKMTLTPAGKLYVEAANKVIKIKNDLYSQIQNNLYKKHITVGITTHFALIMLNNILPIMKKRRPDAVIEVVEGNIPSMIAMLNDNKLDCAIMALNNPDVLASHHVYTLKNEEIFFLIPKSHPFSMIQADGPIMVGALKQYFSGTNFILSRNGSTLRELTESIFTRQQIPINPVCEANNVSFIRNIVSKGIGVSILSESNVIDDPNIIYYPFAPRIYRKDCFVERSNWLKNDGEKEFEKLILEYFSPSKSEKYFSEISRGESI